MVLREGKYDPSHTAMHNALKYLVKSVYNGARNTKGTAQDIHFNRFLCFEPSHTLVDVCLDSSSHDLSALEIMPRLKTISFHNSHLRAKYFDRCS